jgi:hypothetical protein
LTWLKRVGCGVVLPFHSFVSCYVLPIPSLGITSLVWCPCRRSVPVNKYYHLWC